MDLYSEIDQSFCRYLVSSLIHTIKYCCGHFRARLHFVFTVEVILEGFIISSNRMTKYTLYLLQHCTVHRVTLHELYLYEYFFLHGCFDKMCILMLYRVM